MNEMEEVTAKIKQKAYPKMVAENIISPNLVVDLDDVLGVLGEWQKQHDGYPKAVCLVGSTNPKWKHQYRMVEEELTKAGFVVLTVVWFKDELPNFEDHRDLLERIHFQKIRLSDAVVLIHKDAVGKHTAMEMEFARKIGKKVVVFENIVRAERELGLCKFCCPEFDCPENFAYEDEWSDC